MVKIEIEGSYITLGQLLKRLDVIQSGGQAKYFLLETEVKVNGEKEMRRGRKIVPGDLVEIAGFGRIEVARE